MITEKSMDTEQNDSELGWLAVGNLGMCPTKGDLLDTGTFADSLSDSTSFLQERMLNLDDILLYDKTLCNKETLHPDFADSVSCRNTFSLDYAFLDSSFSLGQDVDAFPSFDHESCEVLMSSPLSCNDLESVLNTDMVTDGLHVEPLVTQICTDLPVTQICTDLPLVTLKWDSDSSDAFSSSSSSYNSETSSPSSSTCFSSQPEKFQGKAKRSKHTKNNNRSSPYDLSKSTESSSPSSSSLPFDSTAGVEQLSKKDKKKLQNKNAAIRYRQKMKAEAKTRLSVEEELLLENAKLKEKVDDLQREIGYITNLMDEVKKASLKASQKS